MGVVYCAVVLGRADGCDQVVFGDGADPGVAGELVDLADPGEAAGGSGRVTEIGSVSPAIEAIPRVVTTGAQQPEATGRGGGQLGAD
jgi:hypothetical protein